MLRSSMICFVWAAALTLSGYALAADAGTAAEARAMLDRAVAAVKADKAKAIEMFNKGEGGFKDRDLYPFCFNLSDGIGVAGPATILGKDARTVKDKDGNPFGEDLFRAATDAKDGAVAEVNYMFPKPGTDVPVPKRSYVTRVADLGCGVGYYK